MVFRIGKAPDMLGNDPVAVNGVEHGAKCDDIGVLADSPDVVVASGHAHTHSHSHAHSESLSGLVDAHASGVDEKSNSLTSRKAAPKSDPAPEEKEKENGKTAHASKLSAQSPACRRKASWFWTWMSWCLSRSIYHP